MPNLDESNDSQALNSQSNITIWNEVCRMTKQTTNEPIPKKKMLQQNMFIFVGFVFFSVNNYI